MTDVLAPLFRALANPTRLHIVELPSGQPRSRLDGIAGVTVRRTAHRIERRGSRTHTRCAFDAVGIPAAICWTATPITMCRSCTAELWLSFEGGNLAGDQRAWEWMPPADRSHVLEDFCADANLFCSLAHLAAWRGAAGSTRGSPVAVAELVELGRCTRRGYDAVKGHG